MGKYFKKIVGEKCYLSPIDPNDYEKYTQWLNDPEIYENLMVTDNIISLLKEKDILEKMAKSNETTFAIVDMSTNNLIGNCGLHNIDNINQTVTLGIFIGDKDYLSKGYGTEAVKLLVNYGFEYLNMNNIMLNTFSYNRRAIKCYEKAGFKEFGRRKQAKYYKNQRYDILYMEILREDVFNSFKNL
ncbi:GNAT family N-acetyltransferase [Petrotoga sp. 9PWA.NaAc.5.4]|uniref:GNAT family N-acetyltransferase n=1 Tax=Petrotoga sp. 9PWA.NaAc.5.4 TaxID=1434328 RepID=UPI000CC74F2B|nr:GNAT family protein [Petrotoga sp. 9PWA.NaAc.5.4]PNR96676.1 acetyltransferase [Petrotoga sp. 9PWA.NaAc.5.4]